MIRWTQIASHWSVVANLLAGSLLGAWVGASTATRVSSGTLRKWIAALLAMIAVMLLLAHDVQGYSSPFLTRDVRFVAGIAVGFGIGFIAAFMGVAGEFLIPTLILLFGTDVKLAGSLFLAVSLPTMLVGFARYSQDSTFAVLDRTKGFVGTMAAGSILGTFVGGRLLGIVPERLLFPLLALILTISAIKTWRHAETKSDSAPVGV